MVDLCPDCGANYALVGKMHRCAGRKPIESITTKEITKRIAAVEATLRWRAKNQDRYRDYMRRRAAEKANASA